MGDFGARPFMFRAGFLILTAFLACLSLLTLPALMANFMPVTPITRGLLVMAACLLGVPLYAILFALLKAPPLLMRAACAFAGLGWVMFTFPTILMAFFEPGFVWSPALALPGVCGLALIGAAAWDQLRAGRPQ